MDNFRRYTIRDTSRILEGSFWGNGDFIRIGDALNIYHLSPASTPKEMISNEPCIIGYCQFTMVTRGRIRFSVNMMEHELERGDIAFFCIGNVVRMYEISNDYESWNVTLSGERMAEALNGTATRPGDLTHMTARATEGQASVIRDVLSALGKMAGQEDCPRGMARGLVNFLFHYYKNITATMYGVCSAALPPRERRVVDGFTSLVYHNCTRERSLDFYSRKLGTTTRYLGIIVKKASGITSKRWIDRAIAEKAKAMLGNGDMQVVRISNELNFPNPSFFSKFFRRMTGMTPLQYRKSLNKAH